MAQRPTVTQMSRKFKSRAFTQGNLYKMSALKAFTEAILRYQLS